MAMSRQIGVICIVGTVTVCLMNKAEAQSTLFGNQTLPSTLGARGSSGGSASSGFGNTGLGNAGAGSTTGFAGPQFNQGMGELSSQIGQGFVGRSDNAGRFVGNRQAGQQTGGNRSNSFNALRRNNRGSNQNNSNNQQDERIPIRPRHKIAFHYNTLQTANVESTLSARIVRLPRFSTVQLTLDANGKVTLNGTVSTTDDIKLAAAMVRLEPGVRHVVNELQVAEGGNE